MKKHLIYYWLLLWLCFLIASTVKAQTVNFHTLLNEMVDRSNLAKYPISDYTLAQFSSYDRATVKPGDSTWFANWDRSMFIRTEANKTGKEYVMFDANGPGAIVRFWMTFDGKDSGKGTLRVYLDGNTTPVIEGTALDILSGKGLIDGVLASSVSETTDYKMRGHNLYLPIPYGKRCKITYQSDNILDAGAKTGGESVYYNINYRSYKKRNVSTFKLQDLITQKMLLASVQKKLAERAKDKDGVKSAKVAFNHHIKQGDSKILMQKNGQFAVKQIGFKINAKQIEQALRSTILEISFDGQQTVWCPLGDFFGTGYQLRKSNTWYTKVDTLGNLSAWWVMPFKNNVKVVVHNRNNFPIDLSGELATEPWKWDQRSMYFGTSWHQYSNLFTGEMKNNEGSGSPFDINYVSLKGKGVYVGDAITLFNTVYAWWGEGDEKVYVDGEQFPSSIGTGTEDYYGYAWCRPEKFDHPFIAQPDGSGNFDPGYTVNLRWRTLDAIPFEKELKFDMEMWHWTRAHINFAPVTFYYMLPGGKANVKPDVENATAKVILKRADLISPLVINNKIEAENMVFVESTGGNFRYQNSTKRGWSDNMQAFWSGAKPGNKLKLNFISEDDGTFNGSIQLTTAPNYGKFRISINDQVALETIDTHQDKLTVKTIDMGKIMLKKGDNMMEVTLLEVSKTDAGISALGFDFLKVIKR